MLMKSTQGVNNPVFSVRQILPFDNQTSSKLSSSVILQWNIGLKQTFFLQRGHIVCGCLRRDGQPRQGNQEVDLGQDEEIKFRKFA